MLKDITNVERVELKPYCLAVDYNDRRVFLSLKNDEELYEWQEDVYSRSPLTGVSVPMNFVHKVHVGFDPNTGSFTVRYSYPPPLDRPPTDRLTYDRRGCQSNGENYYPRQVSPARITNGIPRQCWRFWNSIRTARSKRWTR